MTTKIATKIVRIKKEVLEKQSCQKCYVYNECYKVINKLIGQITKPTFIGKTTKRNIIGKFRRMRSMDDGEHECYEVNIYDNTDNNKS